MSQSCIYTHALSPTFPVSLSLLSISHEKTQFLGTHCVSDMSFLRAAWTFFRVGVTSSNSNSRSKYFWNSRLIWSLSSCMRRARQSWKKSKWSKSFIHCIRKLAYIGPILRPKQLLEFHIKPASATYILAAQLLRTRARKCVSRRVRGSPLSP